MPSRIFDNGFLLFFLGQHGNAVSSAALGLSAGAIIGIVIAVLIVFLIIVDVSCYFMNGCGVLMCMCVHLCGKQDLMRKEKAMEEGEKYVFIA